MPWKEMPIRLHHKEMKRMFVKYSMQMCYDYGGRRTIPNVNDLVFLYYCKMINVKKYMEAAG